MSKHDNIYSILGKMSALEAAAKPAKENILKTLNESASISTSTVVQKLNERFLAEKDLGKHNNATTGFAALAKKTGGGEKGARIAGAQLAKMRKSGKIGEDSPASTDTRTDSNFTQDDIKKLERMRDLGQMKQFAKSLITTPSKKPMQPQKVQWFLKTIDSKRTPMDLIKMMYDLMLSGEGNSVIGTRSSLTPNSYRKTFGEDDASADPANRGEYDREGDMADSDLRTAEDAAQELQSILDADDNLPEWVQAKITKAVDYLDTARDYVKSNPPQHESKAHCDSCDQPMEQCSCGMNEASKPDFLDMDKDGDKKEPMKKAIRDKKIKESIKLDTYVEDAMAEIQNLFILEKAPPGKEHMVKALKNDFPKGSGAPFAIAWKQYNKEHSKGAKKESVREGREHLVENTLQSIAHRFGKEVRDFSQGGDMDENLFHALYDFYIDDMPYGIKKARDGDPMTWVGEHFKDAIDNGEVNVAETRMPVIHEHDHELDELAKLAGLGSSDHELSEMQCNESAEGQWCPRHGMMECGYSGGMGGMMESAKPDFLDVDNDGDEEESFKKAVKDKEIEEDIHGSDIVSNDTGMNINTSMDTRTGRKSVTVTAEGEAAEQLAQMLRMAGMGSQQQEQPHAEIVVATPQEESIAEEYANEPDEKYAGIDTIVGQGDDLNRSKVQDPSTANRAANPIGEDVLKLEGRLAKMYSDLKIHTR